MRERRWSDAERAYASVRRLRRLVSSAAAGVLSVHVPDELSLHDTLVYLERPEIAEEAFRMLGLPLEPVAGSDADAGIESPPEVTQA